MNSRQEKPINDSFSQAILDSLDITMAVIDPGGTIFAVNEAWKRMARNSCLPELLGRTGIGMNYLSVCKGVLGPSSEREMAQEAAEGIEAVLQGTQPSFLLEYPCFSPTRQSWYLMNVTPLPRNNGAVVAHIDITELKHLELHLQAEIKMAAKIQAQLFPQELPHIRGLDLFAYSCPAGQVGGDFYDLLSCASFPFAFIVADISGKGLHAALLAAMAYKTFHLITHLLPGNDPQALLAQMNENLYENLSTAGMFATAFVGCYDPTTRQLLFANAGHSPVVYCPKGGPAVLLKANATGLGILPSLTCLDDCLQFQPQDVLLIGTDGLNESFNATGEMFGYARLLTTIETLAPLSANQIGTELLKTIRQFMQEEPQSDDQTLIVIKGSGTPEPLLP